MKKKISIAIIGSGIAGLTLANFLHKEKNLEIEIFEKDNIKNSSTSGIQISNNARIILNKINFNQFNKKNYCNIHSIKIFDYKNLSKIASLDMNFFNKKNSEYFCIERNKLISFLLNQLNKNIKIHTNKKVIEIKTEDTNQIFFQDGQMKKFDIVVACDGIFSNLRKKLSKENLSFRHTATAYRGIIKNMGKIYSEKVNLYLGKKKHLVIYPINQNYDLSFTGVTNDLNGRSKQTCQHLSRKNEIKHFLRDFHPLIRKSIEKCKNIYTWPIYSHSNTFFGKKNVFFIGDSSHAMAPFQAQGAALAIEDAYILSKLIKNNLFSVKQMEKIRLNRITMIKKRVERNLIIFHLHNIILQKIRNFILNIVCNKKLLATMFFGKIFNFKA